MNRAAVLRKWLKPVVDIHPGEGVKTLLMFIYFFLTICLVYILKPLQKALFLDEFGAQNLWVAYIGEALFLVLIVNLYLKFSKKVSQKTFYYSALIFFASNLVLFRFLYAVKMPFFSAAFYMWQASFSVTITTIFWALANEIFSAPQAKRLFGLIISAGSAGGIAGGMLTRTLVRHLPAEDLMLVASGILLVCVAVVDQLWKALSLGANDADRVSSHAPQAVTEKSDLKDHTPLHKIFLGSSYYFMLLAAVVMLAKMSSTVIDNQFSAVVETAIQGKEERTAFFGAFFAGLNTLSFVMQLFATKIFLRYLGVGFSLWLLPAGTGVLAGLALVSPTLFLGMLLRLFDGSMSYSVQQASKEVLYLPIASAVRTRVKPVIDMLGFRVAKLVAGVLIAVFLHTLGMPTQSLTWLVAGFLPVWLVAVVGMKRVYSQLLREELISRVRIRKTLSPERTEDVLSVLYQEKDMLKLEALLVHRETPIRKLSAMALLGYARFAQNHEAARKIAVFLADQEAFEHGAVKISRGKELLAEDWQWVQEYLELEGPKPLSKKAFQSFFLQLSWESHCFKLSEVLREKTTPFEIKRRVVRILEMIPKQDTFDLLLQALSGSRDFSLRFVVLKALNRIRDENPSIRPPKFLTRQALLKDITLFGQLRQIRNYYQEYSSQSHSKYMHAVLKALGEESRERVFLYLDLLYPHEVIQTIYQGLFYSRSTDMQVRSQAVELLSNTLDPVLGHWIQNLIDPTGRVPKRRETIQWLKSWVQGEDKWLAFMSDFMIGEFNLDQEAPELAGRIQTRDYLNV